MFTTGIQRVFGGSRHICRHSFYIRVVGRLRNRLKSKAALKCNSEEGNKKTKQIH